MQRTKLIQTFSQLKLESSLLKRNGELRISCNAKYSSHSKAKASANIKGDEFDKPIKFSTSRAATVPVEHTRLRNSNRPSYEGYVITMSLMSFFLYFCILREENDIDEALTHGATPEIREFLRELKADAQRKKSFP